MGGNHNNIAPFESGRPNYSFMGGNKFDPIGSRRPTATQNATNNLMGNYNTASSRFIHFKYY